MAITTPLAEKVRAAVACFRATEPSTRNLYVLLEATELQDPKLCERPGVRRLAARRIYAGQHKSLEGSWTVVVGQDLGETGSASVSIPIQGRNFEVTVRETPVGDSNHPFEGVFELRSVEIND